MVDRRALVTGSSGAVGAAVAAELHAAGWSIRGCDTRPGRWTTHHGDLREERLCARITDGVAGVVHTAALHAPHVGHRPDSEFRAVNIEATDYLLRQAARHGVRRFVYTSSTSVYGDAMLVRDRAAWVTEQLVAQPRDIYDDTKLAAEVLTRDRSEAVPSAAVLRIARCFPKPRAVQAAHRLYRGVALHDVARAHRLALERSEVNATLNIAGPRLFRRADTGKLGFR